MKRMVLIPEEKLLQYERQQKGPTLHVAEDRQYEEKGHDVQDGFGEERKELSDDIIVRGISKTMQTRAIALLERLKARPDVISWDDMGQVKIDEVLIPKSNISDLVSSAMRSRKHFDPVASREFFGVLSKLNVPKDLVRNEEGWKGVAQKGKGNIFSDDFLKNVHEMKRLMRTNVRASIYKGGGQKGKGGLTWHQTEGIGRGKRKRPQKGGFAFGPYTQGITGIEKKRRPSQKGGKLCGIPNWECYKG